MQIKPQRHRIVLSLLTPLLFVAAGSREQTTPLPVQKSPLPLPKNVKLPKTIPCNFWQGLFIVDGSLEARGSTEKFIVDTGLNAVVVSQSVTDRMKLHGLPQKYRVNLLDDVVLAPVVVVKALQIGVISFEGATAAELDAMRMLSLQPHPDAPTCWFGTPVLSAFQVTFDAVNRSLLLESPQAPTPKGNDATTLPLILKDGRIYTRLTIPGAKPFLALVDTGSPTTVIPTQTAEKLKIKPFKTPAVVLSGRRKAHAAQIMLPTLTIGEAILKNVPVISIVPEDPKTFDKTFGVIGLDILRRYRVTINYARKKMTLIPYPSP